MHIYMIPWRVKVYPIEYDTPLTAHCKFSAVLCLNIFEFHFF